MDDLDKAIDALARKIQPTMSSDRFRFDRTQIGDVIKIVRATLESDALPPVQVPTRAVAGE